MPTYTSDTLRVSNGEITSHDTGTVATDIKITSAECRWEGIDKEVVTKEYDQTLVEHTETIVASDQGSTEVPGAYGPAPGPDYYPIGQAFAVENNSSQEATLQITWNVGDANSGTIYAASPPDGETITIQPGDSVNLWYYNVDPDNPAYENWEVGYNNDGLDVDHTEVDIRTFTQWRRQEQTEIKPTTDPFVTRDVDGSYDGTISNGTWSPWVSLSGLAEGVNEFYHNISGSGEAYFEFRYDWEYAYPEALKQLRIGSRDGSQIHKVALADPASARLDYNHVRVGVGGTVYAVDVVDPSDPDAIEWARIGTQYGVVCPRAYETSTA